LVQNRSQVSKEHPNSKIEIWLEIKAGRVEIKTVNILKTYSAMSLNEPGGIYKYQ
jgi:hypothetical protein